jgi:diguanylate cyclase (GGDEF)-like protein/PAS domain S-box-containing protein
MDREGRYQLVNTSIEELFGLPKEKIEGRHIEDVLDDEIASRIAERNEQVIETESGHTFEEQFTFQKEEHTFLTTYLPYHEDGEFMGTCVIARDITERKAMRDELEHQALYDSLTHLPNRALFEDRLEQAARRSKRLEKTFAVAYVDLDDFKVVNDSFGHPAGDRLLKRVADRLCKAIREEDTVARIGGDEFMLLLEGIESRRDLEIVGERLRGTFTPPFEVEGVDVHLSASIGFAYPDTPCWGGGEVEEGHLEQLVRIADRAMYDIKASGKTSWQIFDVSERDSAGGRIHRENEIRRAIQDDEFVAHYQPIYRLADGSIAAAEVLARWRDPDDGFVSPGRFIPIAEQSALIAKLGEAIFECACRDFAGLQLREDAETFHLFVNLSPRQVESYESMERLVEMARNDAPESLKFHFEVTETDLLENYEQVRRLQDEGFGILVDDFGTGHSSLSRFKRMPVDGLKLDMEFVHGMLDSPVDAAIVETITELGLRLDIPVIAEGIETEGQLQMLKDIDCTAAQGYHLARPQPFDEVSELLSRELTPLGLRE